MNYKINNYQINNYEQLISISLYLRDHLCNKIDRKKDKKKFMNLTIKVIKDICSNKLDKNVKNMIHRGRDHVGSNLHSLYNT